MTNASKIPVVFDPGNEPYLGRKLLVHFDEMISCCLENNSVIAPKTHDVSLNNMQKMACQVIPQSISLALSIRELIRQGYLFGGHVLVRSFAERVMILMFLHLNPEKIELWNDGWQPHKAPSLAKMLEEVTKNTDPDTHLRGFEMTKHFNSLVHGKPDSILWNVVDLEEGKWGHAPSKILNRPKLCDDLCVEVLLYMCMLVSMMCTFFPELENEK